jgi:hypothetical protein
MMVAETITGEQRNELLALRDMLLDDRPAMPAEIARQFAEKMIVAENREDYDEMVRLLNEALYGAK